jgi:putative two-component system response regulator
VAHVLVVDDEKSIRLTLSEILRREGFDVQSAENADESLKRLSEGHFDVIVTDIVLPRITGVELLKAIRNTAPDVQVIMMTGEPTIDTAAESLRAGACDYLMKPVPKEAILRSVRHAAEIKSLNDERRRLADENQKYQLNLERMVAERTAELNKTNQKLQETIEHTIQVIALTVESRDPYTAGHQQHVAQIARAIAEKMGLAEGQIKGLYMAGMIHDLGKIRVPSEILSKPGNLTGPEFALIRLHPQTGYDILKNIDFPWPIADIVFQHHERLDGSGYPQGLKGHEILLEAKILAVADVVEAMASHRPYRPAYGLEAALKEITRQQKILYDPDVVRACLEVSADQKFDLD